MNDQYNDVGTAQHPARPPFRVFQGTFWSFFWRALLFAIILGVTGGIAAPTAFMLFFSFAIPKTQIKGVNIGCSRDAGFYKKWLPALALIYAIIILVIIYISRDISLHNLVNENVWDTFSHKYGLQDGLRYAALSIISFIGFILAVNYAHLVLHRQIISRIYVTDENEQKNAAFRGSYWSLFGITLAVVLISVLTIGILVPLAVSIYRSYIAKHTEIEGYTLTSEKKFGRHYREWVPLLIVAIILEWLLKKPPISQIYSIVIAYFTYNWFFSGISIQKQMISDS